MGSVGDLARLMNVDLAYLGFLLAKAGVVVSQDGSVNLDLAVKQLSRVLLAKSLPVGAQMTLPLPVVEQPPKVEPPARVSRQNALVGQKEKEPRTYSLKSPKVLRTVVRKEACDALQALGLDPKLHLVGTGMGYLEVGKAMLALNGVRINPRQDSALLAMSESIFNQADFGLTYFERRVRRGSNSGLLLFTSDELRVCKYKTEIIGVTSFARLKIPVDAEFSLSDRIGLIIAKK